MVEVGAADPEAGGGLLGSERVSAATSLRGGRPPGPGRVVQRPVRVRAQVDQEAAVGEPAHHERRHMRFLAVNGLGRGAERVGDPVGRRAAGDRRGEHRGPRIRTLLQTTGHTAYEPDDHATGTDWARERQGHRQGLLAAFAAHREQRRRERAATMIQFWLTTDQAGPLQHAAGAGLTLE
ncbi:hypothetical protein ACFY7C_36290 [Streptomyces sp. NPDC012769]|uniref:hypothetical protein n=1 Tax=Streptomyces sp. NPDC012769 TaxID=3364848 RepID=UPI0036BA5BBA